MIIHYRPKISHFIDKYKILLKEGYTKYIKNLTYIVDDLPDKYSLYRKRFY